jgi:DNA-binding NarL/FixJ family response regulator
VTSCLIADDHPGVLLALTESLEDNGFDVVAAAPSGTSALELILRDSPECAVIDYRMPDLGGPELIERLHTASVRTAIVVYTAEVTGSLGAEVLAAGADAVVLKEAPLDDVVRALRTALEGSWYVDPKLAELQATREPAPLSGREREVLALVAEGLEYSEIGRRLGIGSETARAYLKKACRRLGASTRTEAVAEAIRRGWIE